MAPTIIFGNFWPCHCVQNSEIRPKPDFGGFPRGGQLLGQKIWCLIPDLGSKAAVPSVSQCILLPSDPSVVKTSSFDPSLMSQPLPWWVLHGQGYVHIRIGLLPVVVPGDCLALVLTLCLPHWLLARVQCPMIWGCISTSLPTLPIRVYAPEGRVSWSHVQPLAW